MTDYTLANDDLLGPRKNTEAENKTTSHTISVVQEVPDSWDSESFLLWNSGKHREALEHIVELFNACDNQNRPKGLFLQLGHYLTALNDNASSCKLYFEALNHYPDDNDIITTLAISLAQIGEYEQSIEQMKRSIKIKPINFVAWDSIASSYYQLGENEKSSKAGTNSLIIKDKLFGALKNEWSLPNTDIKTFTQNKKKVIAFSLWGNKKKYIFGALRNLLLAPDIYPDWELWFYTDRSVSSGFLEIIQQLGGKVFLQEDGQSDDERAGWCFQVANDEKVGYFLIRHIDAVFSVREYSAVEEWITSGKWFHIIRDGWTQTELIPAGLWGGIANTLPNLQEMFAKHLKSTVITGPINQCFLREQIWRYIKTSCLIHDRCFKHENYLPVPGKLATEDSHIGACEFDQRPDFQQTILSAWIRLGQG